MNASPFCHLCPRESTERLLTVVIKKNYSLWNSNVVRSRTLRKWKWEQVWKVLSIKTLELHINTVSLVMEIERRNEKEMQTGA